MEISLRMVVVVLIVLIVFAVCVALVTNWGGQSNSAIDGLFKFFESLFGGNKVQAPSVPIINK